MLISCPDRPGIVAAVTAYLFRQGANIVRSAQHTENPAGGAFFMRVEFDLADLQARAPGLAEGFADIAARFAMRWRLAGSRPPQRVAILASREEHCLVELLWRWQSGELPCELALVISNHPDLERWVTPMGIPYHHVPVDPQNKVAGEARIADLLAGERVDLVVLARYMQILSPAFVAAWPERIINIHHSFLPAFVGSNPYGQAWRRGVKIIGATAHYVTADLDAGPIIEQDVQRITHRDTPQDLRRVGRQIERTVLARAVAWHLEDRILVHGSRTVVFE